MNPCGLVILRFALLCKFFIDVIDLPNLLGVSCAIVVPPPQESVDNSPSLFDYGLDNSYNDLIDDFDQYLEYGKEYQKRTAFKDVFYG